MSGKVLIIGKPDPLADAVFSEFPVDYDVRQTDGVSPVGDPGFIPDLICLCLDDGASHNTDAMALTRLYSGGMDVPVMAFCRTMDTDKRQKLIMGGITDVFWQPYLRKEILGKVERLIRAENYAAEMQVMKHRLDRLSQYFSLDVVEKIMSQNSGEHTYGENLEATIFFLDIRNFTTISERLEPNLVASLLNQLYTDFMDLILTYKGSVNKIIGDALLATFGCPVKGENDASNAVQCALAIRDTLKFFNETRPEYLTDNISIGMGIATGRVFAGTIGSYRKMEYTVIGDTVNIAARLEGLTKQTRFDLIIDKTTRDLVGDEIKTRKLKVDRVRGRTQPMEIFLVDGITRPAEEQQMDTVFFTSR